MCRLSDIVVVFFLWIRLIYPPPRFFFGGHDTLTTSLFPYY